MGFFRNRSNSTPLSEDSVREKLRGVQVEGSGGNVVERGLVGQIKIGGGNVSIELAAGDLSPESQTELREACAGAIKSIGEVNHVSVNIAEPGQSSPGASAPKGPAPGAPNERNILPDVRDLIAVASGKGGVGKSTTAVNLAVALKATGAAVGILDADIYGPSIPTMLRVDEQPQQVADQKIRPAEAMGIKVISMGFFMGPDQAAILRGPMVSGYVTQFLKNVVWGKLDYLIIDYPPGTGDIQLTLSQQAPISGAIITTTPQEIALADVRRAISMFETTNVPVLGVCETMSYFICDQCNKRHDIFRSGGGKRIARQTGVPLLGEIPIDPRVAQASDEGVPVVAAAAGSPAAEAYRAIAESVAARLEVFRAERGNYLETFKLEWKR